MKRSGDVLEDQPSKKRNESQDYWTFEDVLSSSQSIDVSTSKKICKLFDDGCSIPFIARYRREMTNYMGPDKLRHFAEEYEALKDVREKCHKVLRKYDQQNVLTPAIKASLQTAQTLAELEAVEALLKTSGGRQTLAERARCAGLEPLALKIFRDQRMMNVEKELNMAVNTSDNLETCEKVTEGVCFILADEIVHSQQAIELINSIIASGNATLKSEEKKPSSKAIAKTKPIDDKSHLVFKNYFDFTIQTNYAKPHQILAINRGEKKKALKVKIVVNDADRLRFEAKMKSVFGVEKSYDPRRGQLISTAIQEGYKRLVAPMIIRRIRSNLTRVAEKASIDVFAENLRNLLLTPPCAGRTILGIDPGFKNGCKLAVIDNFGKVLDIGVIYPTFGAGKPTQEKDKATLINLVNKHNVDLISLGNGNGCRDMEKWLSSNLQYLPKHVKYTIVSEDGASIYSCSPEGLEENPTLEPTSIGAVSIARRLLDPLSEYVKIGPQHIGVGMYQHDVAEQKLNCSLKQVLLECVSFVGLDLNTAPLHLLKHVSGISESVAKKIMDYREKKGSFKSRLELKNVKGLGEKIFEQCAGFVKIGQSSNVLGSSYNPLDSTLVHPESYALAEKIVQLEGFRLDQIGTPPFVSHFKSINAIKFATKIKPEELAKTPQILEALGLLLEFDIRDEKAKPTFRRDVISADNLRSGMELTGVVRNVTHFGAFVDIGVGVNGLIPISKTKREKLSLGHKVTVRVCDVQINGGRHRISLELVNVISN